VRFSLGRPPPDLASIQGRSWLENLSRLMARHRLHEDNTVGSNTVATLETIKSFEFNSDLLRNSRSELSFEVWGSTAAEGVTRYVTIYINSTLQYTITLTNAVSTTNFLIRGKILSDDYTTGDYLTSYVEAYTPGETVMVGISRPSAGILAAVGENEVVTLAVKAEGSTAGNTDIYNFAVDYSPYPR